MSSMTVAEYVAYQRALGPCEVALYAKGRQCRAHARKYWSRAYGSIPAGMQVLHRCDNMLCTRLTHLFLGTAKDNTADMLWKGRGLAGKQHSAETRAKISAANTGQVPWSKGQPLRDRRQRNARLFAYNFGVAE